MSNVIELPLRRALFSAVFANRSQPRLTAGFLAKRHNKHLCPETMERLDQLAALFRRHFGQAHDIQGLRDDGVDVILRIGSGEDTSLVGFQIKSSEERGPEVFQKLKAQYTDAKNGHPTLTDYYILLCWHQKDSLDDQRIVLQSFRGIQDVHIVEPPFAWTFLYELTAQQLQAIVRSQVSDDDPVVNDARSLFLSLPPRQAAILVSAIVGATEPDADAVPVSAISESSLVRRIYRHTDDVGFGSWDLFPAVIKFPTTSEESLGSTVQIPDPEDLDLMEEYLPQDDNGLFHLDRLNLDAPLALVYEARARLLLRGAELEEYLYSLAVSEPRSDDKIEGRDLAQLAVLISDSELSGARQTALLASLLAHNVESARAVCDLLLVPTVYDELGLDRDPNQFQTLSNWVLGTIGGNYFDGDEYMEDHGSRP